LKWDVKKTLRFQFLAAGIVLAAVLHPASAQTQLRSLKGVAVPEPANLGEYVRDKQALIALGKVFFWDMQVGSDGATACATCHFHAGADHRPQNQLSGAEGGSFPLNRNLASIAFPFRLLADPGNRNSAVLRDSSMRAGSMGVFRRVFEGIVLGEAAELGRDVFDKPEFMVGELLVRRVTSRNAPSVYNTA
jgi:hypothetical protein